MDLPPDLFVHHYTEDGQGDDALVDFIDEYNPFGTIEPEIPPEVIEQFERQQEESRRLLNSSSSTLAYMSGGGDYDDDELRDARRKRKRINRQRAFEDRRNRAMMKRMRR